MSLTKEQREAVRAALSDAACAHLDHVNKCLLHSMYCQGKELGPNVVWEFLYPSEIDSVLPLGAKAVSFIFRGQTILLGVDNGTEVEFGEIDGDPKYDACPIEIFQRLESIAGNDLQPAVLHG